ncbi:MAG: deoxyribonuclease IV [Ignavibacteriae bacterium]|nr:deoxyribonuclease IV [Ignavibacteriota bacterium]
MKHNLKTHPDKVGTNSEPLIGAHESIAGGIHKAFERAESVGCRVLQVFTKNSNQWSAKPLTDEDIANYKTTASKSSIKHVIAHDSYLINLCAKDRSILRKSREALLDELNRCEMLGIKYLNFHPGSHMGAGEKEGIRMIVDSLSWVHQQANGYQVKSVLETTAGQGSAVGHRFEHLREIIDGVDEPERMAVCIDTCHIFAAGYDIRTEEVYERTMKEFDDIVGLERLVAFHVNDSKKPLGSRVDRHEHIGNGAIGEIGFRCLMLDTRVQEIPKILETPKGKDLKEDRMNLRILEKLAKT